jgi:hypothetical protein
MDDGNIRSLGLVLWLEGSEVLVGMKMGPRKKRAGSRIGMMDSRLCGAIYREVMWLRRSRSSLSLREKWNEN